MRRTDALTLKRGKPLAAALALSAAVLPATDAAAESRDTVRRIVAEEARGSDVVPVSLALAVARVESNFNDDAKSDVGARGVMQIMPKTARNALNVAPDRLWDARTNVRAGIRYLEKLYRQYDRQWRQALSHYNGGTLDEDALGRARPHGYTREYVHSVLTWNQKYQEQGTRVQLASAADELRDRQRNFEKTTREVNGHPQKYWLHDDPYVDRDWRDYNEVAGYWLSDDKAEKAEKTRERQSRETAAAGEAVTGDAPAYTQAGRDGGGDAATSRDTGAGQQAAAGGENGADAVARAGAGGDGSRFDRAMERFNDRTRDLRERFRDHVDGTNGDYRAITG